MENTKGKARLIAPGHIFTFILITFLFFLWAWPNTLNDVLIKQFQKSLELSLAQTGFLPFALKCGYFCFSIPAGLFMQKKGYKSGILMGLVLFALGCLLFYPSAASRTYGLFLGGIFIMAGGASFLEIGANSFVVALGDKSTSERRLNLAQSFNPLGGIAAAFVGTHFIFSGIEPTPEEIEAMKLAGTYDAFLESENMRVFPCYLALAVITLVVAVLIWRTRFPKVDSESGDSKGSFRKLIKYPHWCGAVISQFFYLGAQLGTWSYLITYIQQNSGMGEKVAGGFLTANMVLFMLGRFFSTFLMKYVKPQKLMSIYALINILLLCVAVFGSSWGQDKFGLGFLGHSVMLPLLDLEVPIGILALISTTFFMSLMYPTNFASGIKGLGPHAKLGASILMMSLIGGAVLSFLMGRVADTSWAGGQISASFFIPMISYAVIFCYALWGSKPRGELYE